MADTPIAMRNELIGQYLVKQLQNRNFDACYCSSKAQVQSLADSFIPGGSTVAWGGSATIRELGLTAHMHSRVLTVIDRDLAKSPEGTVELSRQGLLSDFYLTSTNAATEDGILVNSDGNGNRVAAMSCGPRHAIVVCGINKVCPDLQAAVSRARGYAAPINRMRFAGESPGF